MWMLTWSWSLLFFSLCGLLYTMLWLYLCQQRWPHPLHYLSLYSMERSSPLDVTIIDMDDSADRAYHVVDGFVIEDSKNPFPVSHMTIIWHNHQYSCISLAKWPSLLCPWWIWEGKSFPACQKDTKSHQLQHSKPTTPKRVQLPRCPSGWAPSSWATQMRALPSGGRQGQIPPTFPEIL